MSSAREPRAPLVSWEHDLPREQIWAGLSRSEWELAVLVSRLPLWVWPLISRLYYRNLLYIKELSLAEVMTLEQEALDPRVLQERPAPSLLRQFHDELWVAMRLVATPLNVLNPLVRNPLLHRQTNRIGKVYRALEESLGGRIADIVRQFFRGKPM